MASRHDTLANRLRAIHGSAGGGVLVLLPGYASIEAPGQPLEATLGEDLVVQRPAGF